MFATRGRLDQNVLVNFVELSPAAQVRTLRSVAASLPAAFGVEARRLRLISQSYNATYRVDAADGRRFAMRININSRRRPGELLAEVSWVAALAASGTVRVPRPEPTIDGSYVAWTEVPSIDRPIPAVLYSWLDGRDLGRQPVATRVRTLGAAMARMHRQAADWQLPPGAELTPFDRPLLGDTRHIDEPHDLIDAGIRRTLVEAEEHAAVVMRRVFERERRRIIHADLHGGNVRWHRGELSVFDFDDCLLGTPTEDLATSIYYLDDRGAAEEMLTAGYESVTPLPPIADGDLDALLAARNLLILNSLLVHTSRAMRDLLPAFLHNTVIKLRGYLDEGVYRHDRPGLVPFG